MRLRTRPSENTNKERAWGDEARCIHDLRKLIKYQNFDPKNADSAMAKFSS